ncbi:polysaccharide export protein [Sphingomonas sp. QA11]|uniref:polysaccharide biosynthesis/export family protein n=1 Tax=Sphingomonas sp. QA11 TaxID=2950605 RepID=UPI00234BC22C|nr:polysaccharide biosynthesis/export family protein [Sphingomonas sp. QA11]WCM29676.1 polysaccharide export protein [Sphingomonas sp. QA11]
MTILHRLRTMVVALLVPAILAGCSTGRGGSIPYEVKNFGRPDAPVAAAPDVEYRIGALDQLSIIVYRVPDLSGELPVDATGKITMPLIGEISAVGKTSAELASEIKRKLGEKYINNPEVQVVVKSASSARITVDGSVGAPGIYPIAGPTTLLQAVAMAKGTTDDANPRRVVIFRQINGQRQAAAFDLKSIRRGEMADAPVFGDDIVVVDGSASKSAFKNVMQTIPLLALFRPF